MNRHPILYLIRGLPGSGKSTLAQKMISERREEGRSNLRPMVHFEADMFHINEEGEYVWKPKNVKAAHNWCQGETLHFLGLGYDVVVSNTFIKTWEMKKYFEMGYHVEVIECKGTFGSIHNVPQDTLDRMEENWEEYEQQK